MSNGVVMSVAYVTGEALRYSSGYSQNGPPIVDLNSAARSEFASRVARLFAARSEMPQANRSVCPTIHVVM